ncbi:hypothetical protein Amet_3248 [Alkaliphilus metalliredigens QYMF]|uniref:Chromo domain-containing protein n=1 Tax=Alkaliphilus metalliredigens (strain QYMF) TaxID=293826 RepID=A6TT68_ALKMQ|nr:hypothetical protein [Alkaliphilus metalliredigens]ABR49386.1 hypothetical protein Amet_3248 [Alkaliphilus metalliredigens QYMF]
MEDIDGFKNTQVSRVRNDEIERRRTKKAKDQEGKIIFKIRWKGKAITQEAIKIDKVYKYTSIL